MTEITFASIFNPMRVGLGIIAVSLLLLMGCGTEPEYPVEAPECTLYWISFREGPPNIWMMDFPKGKPRRFTDFTLGCGRWGFDISPSGECFVTVQIGSDWNIFRVSNPCGAPVQITFESQYDGEHAISPLGDRVCFVTKRWYFDIYDRELAIMGIDGSNLSRVTVWRGSDDSPAWSPDGTKIAFVREMSYGQYAIMMKNIDTPDTAIMLTDPLNYAYNPIWTPDGNSIICVMTVNGVRDIFRVPIDGGSAENITQTIWSDEGPALSPCGGLVAHRVYRSGRWDIAVTRIDGSSTWFLTDDPKEDLSPCWSPDGSWVFWVGQVDGDREIFGAPADGGFEPYRITNSPNDDIRVICR